MTENFISTLLIIPYYFIGLSMLVGILTYRRHTRTQRILFLLIIITAVVEALSTLLWSKKINNMPIFHIYGVVEFLLLSSIYKNKLYSFNSKRWMNVMMILFVGFSLINVLFIQNLHEFNSNGLTFSSLCMIFFSILYFIQLLRESKYSSLERIPMFWINVGVLIYFSSSIFLFHLSNMLIPESLQVRGVAWGVHAIFNVFHYLAFTIALWVRPMN